MTPKRIILVRHGRSAANDGPTVYKARLIELQQKNDAIKVFMGVSLRHGQRRAEKCPMVSIND
jgi:hypothetical protein